jgi:dihydroflavonol-4-reductase
MAPPGSFSVVDARDVAACEIAAAERGGRGQRYLAAGRHMTMAELLALGPVASRLALSWPDLPRAAAGPNQGGSF